MKTPPEVQTKRKSAVSITLFMFHFATKFIKRKSSQTVPKAMSNWQNDKHTFSAQSFSLGFRETRGFFGAERASNLTWDDFPRLSRFLFAFNCDWNVVCLVYDWFHVSHREKKEMNEWLRQRESSGSVTSCVIVMIWSSLFMEIVEGILTLFIFWLWWWISVENSITHFLILHKKCRLVIKNGVFYVHR